MNAVLPIPNAIVFLHDLSARDVVIPEYIDDVLVSSNDSCVSIGTQAEVDGDVKISLSNVIDDVDKVGCKLVFDGAIETPTKEISLSTCESDCVLAITVTQETAQVLVWVDDERYPALILIQAR